MSFFKECKKSYKENTKLDLTNHEKESIRSRIKWAIKNGREKTFCFTFGKSKKVQEWIVSEGFKCISLDNLIKGYIEISGWAEEN